MSRLTLAILISASFLCACNSSDGERFKSQKDAYTFVSTSSTLIAYGASKIDESASSAVFRCPSVSGMSSENNLTIFEAQANAPFPYFTLETIPGIRGDSEGGIGISLHNLQITLFDLYEKCNSSSYERLITSCEDGTIIESCEDAQDDGKYCEQIYEGLYQLVISSEVLNDDQCFSEENDRSPYGSSVPNVAYACDAFSPIPLAAAYRGTPPLRIQTSSEQNSTSDHTLHACCSTQDPGGSFDFCFKPCGCRKLTVKIVPKDDVFEDNFIDNQTSDGTFNNSVRLAVFSNVEDNKGALKKLFESIALKEVDAIISLGNLTEDGSIAQFTEARDFIDQKFTIKDGSLCFTKDDFPEDTPQDIIDTMSLFCCDYMKEDEQVCCAEDKTRVFDNICNAVFYKKSFIASLGEDEYQGEGLATFTSKFGPSNSAFVIGKVQLVLLDTADASLSSGQRSWLKDVFDTPDHTKCNIPAPTRFESWPTLSECRSILNKSAADSVTCRECIQTEAKCVVPDAKTANYALGPENCVCVPLKSKICKNNLTCQKTDGTDSTCICTRDEDCGNGGTCGEDGFCTPPLRLVFSYTPLFDKYGSRGNAFTSKDSAASLLSLFAKSHVSAIFSGRSHEFSSFSMAGIPMYLTGGGGADMTAFSDNNHHWLYVTIPNAYTNPRPEDISVEVIEF